MKSTLEPLEGNKVKLSVEVDEAEFDRDIDAAFRAIARQVRLPGFRAGKVPRKVLEARIGLSAAREQALRTAIPHYLARAVREHDVDLVATPKVEITGGADGGPVVFDATCEVRPEITVPGYGGLRVELPSIGATDAEVAAAVEAERKRHGQLTTVDRPAQVGDYVTVDVTVTRDGAPVTGLNTEDWLYEIGRGWVAEGFDDRLVGARAGDTLRFSATLKGTSEPADFTVTVSEVHELALPEVDDVWVAQHLGEFDDVAAWTDALRERIGREKLNLARSLLISRTTDALAELVDVDPPESMVASELQGRLQSTFQQLQSQGVALEAWLAAAGHDVDSFVAKLRAQSEKAVKVDLALRAVAAAEGLDVTDEDLEAEYARLAAQTRRKPAQVRAAYERNDAVVDLIAELRKAKALDWLIHHVELVDPEGHPIDRDLLLGQSRDDDRDDQPETAA